MVLTDTQDEDARTSSVSTARGAFVPTLCVATLPDRSEYVVLPGGDVAVFPHQPGNAGLSIRTRQHSPAPSARSEQWRRGRAIPVLGIARWVGHVVREAPATNAATM